MHFILPGYPVLLSMMALLSECLDWLCSLDCYDTYAGWMAMIFMLCG
jgi:hypothetical protein